MSGWGREGVVSLPLPTSTRCFLRAANSNATMAKKTICAILSPAVVGPRNRFHFLNIGVVRRRSRLLRFPGRSRAA
jgi:hypothetical protein